MSDRGKDLAAPRLVSTALESPAEPESFDLEEALVRGGHPGAVVVFWSSVCSHCRRYDDSFKTFAARHPDLLLVLVACRQGETSDDLRGALEARGLGHLEVVHDATTDRARDWGVQQTPTAFLVDAERRVFYRGAIDDFTYPGTPGHRAYLEQAIDAFLGGDEPPRRSTAPFGCPVASIYYRRPPVTGLGGETSR